MSIYPADVKAGEGELMQLSRPCYLAVIILDASLSHCLVVCSNGHALSTCFIDPQMYIELVFLLLVFLL